MPTSSNLTEMFPQFKELMGLIETGQGKDTLVHAMKRNSETFPDHALANWVNGECQVVNSLTYKKLWDKAGRVACLLLRHEVKPGDRVMIAYDFGLEFIVGMFGCMRMGAIACSVYPPNFVDKSKAKYSFDQFNSQAQDAGAKYALTSTTFKRGLMLAVRLSRNLKTPGVSWLSTSNVASGKLYSDEIRAVESIPINAEDIAFIQYSSGSTGNPKGIVLTHKAVCHNIRACHAVTVDTSQSDLVWVTWMPQYHDYALIAFYLTACYSPHVNVFGCSPIDFIRNPLLWADMMDKFRATHIAGPNFSYALLAKRMRAIKRQLSAKLQRANIAAEPISPRTIEAMEEIGIEKSAIMPCYGLAEVCAYGTACWGDEISISHEGVVSSGLTLRNERYGKFIRIADRRGLIVQNGVVGEIYIRGPDLASGYWNNSEASDRFHCMLSDGLEYFATGDLGKIEDDRLYIMGRLKELIIINGKNVYPTDLERTIEAEYSEYVRPGSTVAFQYGDSTVGVVLEMRDAKKRSSVTGAFVSTLLLNAHGVSSVSIIALKKGSVPKTTSGKLKRFEARRLSLEGTWNSKDVLWSWTIASQEEMGQSSTDVGAKLVPCDPGDKREAIRASMVAVVGDHLDMEKIWEENGLSSLKSAELSSTLVEQYHLSIPIDFETKYPTPSMLLEFVAEAAGEQFATDVPDLKRETNHLDSNKSLSLTSLILLQTIGIVGILMLFVAALIPPFFVGKVAADFSVTFEIGASGRYATWAWIPTVVPVFFLSLSVELILVKWVLIGRYRSTIIDIPSISYFRWWFVDRFVHMWELWVGIFILDTKLAVLVYKLLGARIPWSANIDGFLREFDLVSVGEDCCIQHQVRCRKVDSLPNPKEPVRLAFRPIKLGKGCTIKGMVSPGCVIDDGAVVETNAALAEGSVVPANVVAKGSPAHRGGMAKKRGRDSSFRQWVFATVKCAWLLVELYMFFGAVLLSQLILNQQLPVDWRYSKLLYWFLLLPLSAVMSLLASVILKWVLIGRRLPTHEETLHRSLAYWVCDTHFRLSAYTLWATLHNSRFWNIVFMLHGMDVDLITFFTDITHFPPSKVDLIRVRKSFLSTGLSFQVGHQEGKTEVIDSSIGFGVVVSPGVKIHRSSIPIRAHVTESIADTMATTALPEAPLVITLRVILKELSHLTLFALIFPSLIPSFEFFSTSVLECPMFGLAFLNVFLSIAIQCLVWIFLIRVVQFIFVRPGVDSGLYTTYVIYGWSLKSFAFTFLLWGTPFFGHFARFMGSTVNGTLWYLGSSIYDYNMIEFSDSTIVDDAHITGHYAVLHDFVIRKTKVGGVMHPGCYAHAGAVVREGEEHGPWKSFVQASGKLDHNVYSGRIQNGASNHGTGFLSDDDSSRSFSV